MTRFTRATVTTLLLALAGLPGAAGAEDLDWTKVAEVGVIEVITTDEDGDVRESKVWFVLIDGVSYLRTSGSRWLENIQRDPNVTLRIEGVEYPQVAHEVTSDELIEQVDAATREKYGFQDAVIHAFRINDPQILKLSIPLAP